MANYNSLKNAGLAKPSANVSLGSDSSRYTDIFLSGNVNIAGTSLTSTNAVTPRIATIAYVGDDTAAAPAGGQTITLTGSGFVSSSVYVGGTIVASVSVVNSTQLTFVAPAKTAGNYSLNVVNSDGASATFIPGMQYSGVPTWSTSAGSLGSVSTAGSVNFTVAATSDSTVSYSVTSGSLPSGVSLNSSTGVISGTAPAVGSSTTYNFTIRATDSENQDTDRNFSISVTAAISVEYLVVAGGGGGGGSGSENGYVGAGGGGAGGLLSGSVTISPGVAYTVTVGAGGPGGSAGSHNTSYGTGFNSSISGSGLTTVTSYGGGTGGWGGTTSSSPGGNGGSGGGIGAADMYNKIYAIGGKGVYPGSSYNPGPRQGYDGGGYNTGSGNDGGGASGGGAGAAGTPGSSGYGTTGGIGVEWPTGSGTYYAGGGGGGSWRSSGGGGGQGGGGAGGSDGNMWVGAPGNPGTANTGGGGGGALFNGNASMASRVSRPGGAGGSGVVIVRYADSNPAASATTGSPTVTVAGGYRVYKFTSSGSITF